MTLNMRRLLFFTFVIIIGNKVFCQETEQSERRPDFEPGFVQRDRTGGEIVFFEVHYVLHPKEMNNVIALYRIREDFLTFAKDILNPQESYSAKADVAVEILDSNKNSVTRQIKNIELESESNTNTDLKKKYFQGVMSFSLPAGKYTALFSIEDKGSNRIMPDIRKPMIIPTDGDKVLSPLIPVETSESDSTFRSFNLGGDVEFSTNFGLLFVTSFNNSTNAKYIIKKLSHDEDEPSTVIIDTVVDCKTFSNATLTTKENAGQLYYSVDSSTQSNVYYIPIQGINLRQGRYEMEVRLTDSIKVKTQFAARWLDMPMSLNDLDLAIFPLQHILTKDEYSDINSGSRSSRVEKFNAFWKKKDPTPATAYNEMMAEFYRRVDYTINTYRTLKEPNGSLTDRGKIYILYGKPTATERTLNPGESPREIWKYEYLKKTFIFEDKSKQGNYKLVERR